MYFALRLARSFVPVLGCLVANQAEDAPDNIGDSEFVGLGLDESAAGRADILDESIDVLPSRLGDDLEEDLGGGDGAGLGALDLSSLEEATGTLEAGRSKVEFPYEIRVSMEASSGSPLCALRYLSKSGA